VPNQALTDRGSDLPSFLFAPNSDRAAFTVNITVNDVSETRKTLSVALEPAEVAAERDALVGEFAKAARIPGFRPGKAPKEMILKRYERQIADELKDKVVAKAYRGAIDEQKLAVLAIVQVEPGPIAGEQPVTVNLTVDITPQFALPEYKEIPATSGSVEPTDAEIDEVIEQLRTERADFQPADRPAQKGDYVKLGYTGSVDGKPIAELVPDKQIYGAVPQTWEEVEGEHEGVLPGLGKQLAGAKSGETRTVTIAFPAEFSAAPELAGKSASYELSIQEIRERVLPELNEAFFKEQKVENLEGLKAQVRTNLKLRKEYENRADLRRQVTETLAARVDFPVPQSLVDGETQGILRRFIEENMRRGVPQEQFEKDKQALVEGARKAAVARVKLQLLLNRVAEAEKITAVEKDFDTYIYQQAARSGQKPEKLAKELSRDRDQLRAAQQAIIRDKTIDFLVDAAKVSPAAAAAKPESTQ